MQLKIKVHTRHYVHGTLKSKIFCQSRLIVFVVFCCCPLMVTNVSVQYNGGFLPVEFGAYLEFEIGTSAGGFISFIREYLHVGTSCQGSMG